MTPMKNTLLRAAALSACLVLVTCYDYSEILRLNASCTPKDTCSFPRDLDDSQLHSCDCGSLCVLHNTCCIDSPFRNHSRHFAPRRAACRKVAPEETYFMLDTCPEAYSGPLYVRRRCEQNAKDWSDPFNNVPVTNPSLQKTYKSVFCAICNGEDVADLVMWEVVLDCSSLGEDMAMCTENRDFVLKNMIYLREKSQWGVWSHDPNSDWMFRYLHIGVKIPDDIMDYVRECRPNLVSTCSPDWADDSVRRLCRSYMGVVYLNYTAYRNAHCALCNGESLEEMSCYEKSGLTYKSPAMNFGILLDIDLTDGVRVGIVQRKCREQQVYDPFSKKCRTIECPLPGSVLRNGKCCQAGEDDES